jgi:ketosteroid isomerase-like protein
MTHRRSRNGIVAMAICTGLVYAGTARARSATPPPSPVSWDESASKELTQALHHMHTVWNSGDIKALKGLMPGDDALVTYELSPYGHTPIRLKGKAAIDKFVDDVVDYISGESATSVLEMPAISCKATGQFGVCTEECTIHLKKQDGSERIDRLWSTAIAVKYPEGWKWIQWHMSVGTPSQYLKNGKPITQ